MSRQNATDHRWLRSVIAAAAEPLPEFHWMRTGRRRPASLDDKVAADPAATTRMVAPRRRSPPGPGAIAAS